MLGAGNFTIVRTEAVGPKVGGELRSKAFLAIFLSFFAVLAYLAYRFEWRFGLAAVIATAHDILATIAFIGVLRLEVSLTVVAARALDGGLLAQRHDHHLRPGAREPEEAQEGALRADPQPLDQRDPAAERADRTAPRSSSLLALAIFGGEVIRPFALVMFFGVFTGTFSSIFIASPVLMAIEKRWPGQLARGHLAPTAAPAPVPGGGRKPAPVA